MLTTSEISKVLSTMNLEHRADQLYTNHVLHLADAFIYNSSTLAKPDWMFQAHDGSFRQAFHDTDSLKHVVNEHRLLRKFCDLHFSARAIREDHEDVDCHYE